jgi:hypothetical protein
VVLVPSAPNRTLRKHRLREIRIHTAALTPGRHRLEAYAPLRRAKTRLQAVGASVITVTPSVGRRPK